MKVISESNGDGTKTVSIRYSGWGGEVRIYLLNKDDLLSLKEAYDEDRKKFAMRLSGFEENWQAINMCTDGPGVDEMSLTVETEEGDENLAIDLEKQAFCIGSFTDKPQYKCLDDGAVYFFVTDPDYKHTGTISVILKEKEQFKPQKLSFGYDSFDFKSYFKLSKKVLLAKVLYDNVECEFQNDSTWGNLHAAILAPVFDEKGKLKGNKVIVDYSTKGLKVNFKSDLTGKKKSS